MKLSATPTVRWADFSQLEQMLVPKLLAGAQAGADLVLGESQALVPVRGGALKASGSTSTEWKGRAVWGYVTYSAAWAAFVEFGTGIHGRGTYPFNLPQEGVPITGSWIYDYKEQDWQGAVAQPFLRPALDNMRDAILRAFREALVF